MLAIAIIMTVILGIIFGIASFMSFVVTFWSHSGSEIVVSYIVSVLSSFLIVGTWILYCHIPA